MRRKTKSVSSILSRNVRALRERLALSQEQLAKKADLPRSTVSNIEGQRYSMPRGVVLESVATALGVSVSDLLAENKRSSSTPS